MEGVVIPRFRILVRWNRGVDDIYSEEEPQKDVEGNLTVKNLSGVDLLYAREVWHEYQIQEINKGVNVAGNQ